MYYCGITGKGPEDQLGEPQLWEEHTSESCIYIFSFFESFFFSVSFGLLRVSFVWKMLQTAILGQHSVHVHNPKINFK